MRKSKFSESQIVGILKEAESGVPVADLLRQHGISRTTFFKWRSKYAGASVADVKRLRELEGENAKLGIGEGARPFRRPGHPAGPDETVDRPELGPRRVSGLFEDPDDRRPSPPVPPGRGLDPPGLRQ